MGPHIQFNNTTTTMETNNTTAHKFKVGDFVQSTDEWENQFFGKVLACYNDSAKETFKNSPNENFCVIELLTDKLKSRFTTSDLHFQRINHIVVWEPTIMEWTPEEQLEVKE